MGAHYHPKQFFLLFAFPKVITRKQWLIFWLHLRLVTMGCFFPNETNKVFNLEFSVETKIVQFTLRFFCLLSRGWYFNERSQFMHTKWASKYNNYNCRTNLLTGRYACKRYHSSTKRVVFPLLPYINPNKILIRGILTLFKK